MSVRHSLEARAYDKRGRLLSVGRNSYLRTHPIQALFASKAGKPASIYIHAEIAALIRANKPVHTLRITRKLPGGGYGPAKPCVICQLAIAYYNVKHVEHT